MPSLCNFVYVFKYSVMTGLLISIFFLFQQTIAPDTIRIGLLVQDKQSYAARHAAALAVDQANLKEKSLYFKLEVRDMEGPWGTGAKQTVSLVFNEDVKAVIGSVDGRNSHLAEQVSAKTRIPYISAASGDPTLGQAFIPWYFSCVYNDLQIASIMIDRVYRTPDEKVVIVSDDGYDSKMSVTSFLRECRSKGKPEPEIHYYNTPEGSIDEVLKNLSAAASVIFYGNHQNAAKLVAKLSSAGHLPFLIAPNLLMTEKQLSSSDLRLLEGIIVINPNIETDFASEFNRSYGYKPGPVAAYAFDAVNVLIAGIKLSGNDDTDLYRQISGISLNGVTGRIAFDRYGHRTGDIGLIKIQSGKLIEIED